jgi:hypothetical protein
MDIPNDTTELGDRTYRVSFLTTKAFYELLSLLGNLAGPSISEFLAGVEGSLSQLGGNVDNKAVGNAVYQLCTRANAKDLERLQDMLSRVTTVDGSPIGDAHHIYWTKHRRHLLPWLAFALRVQLSDFFAGGADALKALAPNPGDQESQAT